MSATTAFQSTPQDLQFDYKSSNLRLFFRIYLIVIFIIVSYIGNKCCSARVKLHLLRSYSVRLTDMTGWLPDTESVFAWKRLRTLPASNWLGSAMIFSFLLYWANDLAVAKLVRDEEIKARCRFGTGLVLSNTPPPVSPPWNGRPAVLVAQAQDTSKQNGGLRGVYRKVNRSLKFSADPIDLLGRWICVPHAKELMYPSDTSDEAVIRDVAKSDQLYRGSIAGIPWCTTYYNNDISTWAHLVVLDTSLGEKSGSSFDVRVSLDETGEAYDSKIMRAYECKPSDLDMDGVLSAIPSRTALTNWCQTLQGLLYNGRYTDAIKGSSEIIEGVLNSLTMVAGGDNYELNKTAQNETQGCLVTRATIHWSVIALASTATLLLIILLVYWLVLVCLIRTKTKAGRNSRSYIEKVKKDTPGDVYEWMAQAVRERQSYSEEYRDKEIRVDNLRKWKYGGGAVPGGSVGVILLNETNEEVAELNRSEDSRLLSGGVELCDLDTPGPEGNSDKTITVTTSSPRTSNLEAPVRPMDAA